MVKLHHAATRSPPRQARLKSRRQLRSLKHSGTFSTLLYVLRFMEPSAFGLISLQLRVNQAGELAATLIYEAQTPPLVRAHPQLRPLMAHMHSQEAGHLRTFNSLVASHRVRPTVLTPVWRLAATVLGWTTGMMGREAAMACTEAVETEIGGHYNEQVRELLTWMRAREANGEQVGEELRDLVAVLKRIRDEELEHLDTAVEHDAKKADGYPLLTNVIRAGCKGAIWLSQRI